MNARGASALPLQVIVASVGTAGDMFPFLAMADALRRRGHRVQFMCPAAHEAHVRRGGLPFGSLVDDEVQRDALADPDLWHPTRGLAVVWRTLRDVPGRLIDAVKALPPGDPCVLLVHPILVPYAALARHVRPGVTVVTGYLAPSNLRSVEDPMRAGPARIPRWVPVAWRRALWRAIDRRVVDPVMTPTLNAHRRAHGLPPVPHLMEHLYAAPDAALTLFPEWFAPAAGDWPQPLVRGPFPLHHPDPSEQMSDELHQFLAAGAPPVVFTPGSGHHHATRYFRAAVQASARRGVRAVLLTSDPSQLPVPLPPHALWQAWVPLHALLPRAAAFVHHGGIGSTAEALRAGVPQLVVPMAHDQFDNAERVREMGAGHVLRTQRLTTGALSRALGKVLQSTALREGSRAARSRFADAPDMSVAADLVESAVAAATARAA